MWPNQIFLPIGKCISHSCWKQIHCLKLYILRPKKHLLLFEFSNNNSRIKCEICSKLTIEATDVVLVTSLLTFNIVDTFLVFFCWVWTYKCQMENFIAWIWIYIVYFRVWSRSPEAKPSLTTVNKFPAISYFCQKELHLRCCTGHRLKIVRWSTKILNGIRGSPQDWVQPWENMKNSPS